MTEHTHQPCPYIDCGSSDAFSYNDEGYGFCQSCKTGYPSATATFPWAQDKYPTKQKATNMERKFDLSKIKTASYDNIRGIDADVCKLYGIVRYLDSDNNTLGYGFKYPTNVKIRDNSPPGKGKTIFWKEKGAAPVDWFGPPFNAGTSKMIYITEGEFDAASLYQAMGKTRPVVSASTGGISKKFLQEKYDELAKFDTIIWAGELDEAGRANADRLYNAFPEKMYYVSMTKHKDANDFLTAGDTDDLKWAALKPQRYSPDNFFCSDEAVETAILTENPYQYTPLNHTGLDGTMRGLIKGGLTFIKAPRGTGKTEIARFFEMSVLQNSTASIALLHMEEQKSTTYRSMASYHLGINVRTKDDAEFNGISESQVVTAAKEATQGERTVVFEMRSHDDPLSLLDHVRLAATVYGCEYIFIDHVQRLAYLSSAGVDGATSTLTVLASRAAQLAKELNIGIIFLSQVNQNGSTKYAMSLEEEAIVVIELERDVESEDEIERNTTQFILSKNRPFSKLGHAGSIYFDPDTFLLREEF